MVAISYKKTSFPPCSQAAKGNAMREKWAENADLLRRWAAEASLPPGGCSAAAAAAAWACTRATDTCSGTHCAAANKQEPS